jgi:hypothetical protein
MDNNSPTNTICGAIGIAHPAGIVVAADELIGNVVSTTPVMTPCSSGTESPGAITTGATVSTGGAGGTVAPTENVGVNKTPVNTMVAEAKTNRVRTKVILLV